MAAKKKTAESKVEEIKAYRREKTVKELAVEKLSARGIIATIDSGVVMVRVYTPEELKAYKQAIKDIGYDQSWGFKVCKGENRYEAGRTVEGTQSEGSEDYT